MVFRLPCMNIIFSDKKHISCFTFILPGLKESEVCDNYFALERLQKQSLWRRKTRRKKNFGEEKLSVSTFLSSPRVLLFRRVLLRNSFQQLLSFPKKNPKEICPTSSFLMNVLKGNHRHFVFGAFSEENLSQWCVMMMIAGWGKFCPKLIY